MMLVEVLAEFDPFLREHIRKMETLVKPGRHLSAGRGRNVELWPRAQKVVNPGLLIGSEETGITEFKPALPI